MVMLDNIEIYELRKALGMTAAQFGAKIGVTGNTVFRWEAERPTKFPNRRHLTELNKLRDEAIKKGLLSVAAA